MVIVNRRKIILVIQCGTIAQICKIKTEKNQTKSKKSTKFE